jgi:hypothetical protein
MLKSYANIEKMLAVAKEVEMVFGELSKTPFEFLKEKHEEGMTINTTLEKQVIALKGVCKLKWPNFLVTMVNFLGML